MLLGETKIILRPKISSPVRENWEEGEDDEDEEDTQLMIFAPRQSGGGEERCTPGLSVLWLIPLYNSHSRNIWESQVKLEIRMGPQ